MGIDYSEIYDINQLNGRSSSLAQSSLEDSLNSTSYPNSGSRRRWSMWDGFKRGLGVGNERSGNGSYDYQLVENRA